MIDMATLQRIHMYVIHIMFIIRIIADKMFPIMPLPTGMQARSVSGSFALSHAHLSLYVL